MLSPNTIENLIKRLGENGGSPLDVFFELLEALGSDCPALFLTDLTIKANPQLGLLNTFVARECLRLMDEKIEILETMGSRMKEDFSGHLADLILVTIMLLRLLGIDEHDITPKLRLVHAPGRGSHSPGIICVKILEGARFFKKTAIAFREPLCRESSFFSSLVSFITRRSPKRLLEKGGFNLINGLSSCIQSSGYDPLEMIRRNIERWLKERFIEKKLIQIDTFSLLIRALRT